MSHAASGDLPAGMGTCCLGDLVSKIMLLYFTELLWRAWGGIWAYGPLQANVSMQCLKEEPPALVFEAVEVNHNHVNEMAPYSK